MQYYQLPLPIKIIPEKPIRKGRMKQHAKIMTSTPIKDNLVEKKNKKASRAAKGKILMPKASKKQKPWKDVANKAKRRVLQDQSSSHIYVTIIKTNAWYVINLVATMSYGIGALLVAYGHTLVVPIRLRM